MRLEIYNEERFCPVCLLNSRMQSWCQHGGQPTRLKTQFIGVDPHNCFVYKNTKTRLGWGWTLFWLGNLTHSLIYNAHEDRVEYWDIICSCARPYLRTFLAEDYLFNFFLFSNLHILSLISYQSLSNIFSYIVFLFSSSCAGSRISTGATKQLYVVFKGGVPNPSNSRRF